ncbi:hypothetical protein [Grimontia celer]|uniref:hypothetical protein n=1 Tax=Grimontia celer TaxID=1796497 RepID=UPI0007883A88|nr:hypothetical protein [Grimontia celer]
MSDFINNALCSDSYALTINDVQLAVHSVWITIQMEKATGHLSLCHAGDLLHPFKQKRPPVWWAFLFESQR